MTRSEKWVWAAVLCALLAFRLFHLSGPLDEPSWRQAWCAYHAREAFRRWPPEWFVNYINFRGPQDKGAWTFPLYENIVAWGYRMLGRESLEAARLLTLFSYLAATYFLYRIACEIFGAQTALYSTIAFLAMPLGLFYSRAVHYEALLIALTHIFLLCGLRFVRRPTLTTWMSCAASGVCAALIKPTFILWMGTALLAWAWAQGSEHRFRTLIFVGLVFLMPVVAAIGHHFYRLHFEGEMANTPLYADPYNPVYARSWFLGTLREKISLAHWWEICRLTVWMILTPVGALLLVCSPGTWRRREWQTGWWVLVGWCAGLALYTVIFVRIVATHDYWRLPFMAPLAIAMALGLNTVLEFPMLQRARWGFLLALVLAVGLSIQPALRRGPYFQRDWQRIRAGEVIMRHTSPNDLVLSSCIGRSTGPTDPRILNFADRKGWANRMENLSPDMLKEYRGAGASVIAVLVTPEHLPLSAAWDWMLKCPRREETLPEPAEGAVFFYDLSECEL